jgi:predicted methyltransferase
MEHITADEVAKRFNAMISQPPEAIEALHKYIKVAD